MFFSFDVQYGLEFHAWACMETDGLLSLRIWDFVSQPGDFVPLQRMLQQRTPRCMRIVLLVRVQVRLSKLGNRIDLLTNPT